MKEIKFIAAPFHLGANNEGIKEGYEKYKSDIVCEYILDVSRFKKDFSDCKLKNLEAVIEMTNKLSNETFKMVKSGYIPITIGGDHSIALGTISGVSKHIEDLGVIWVDAHGDMNTDDITPSGNIHGMILAALQGIGSAKLTNLVENKISTKNIAIFGVRDLDRREKDLMDKVGINYYPYKIIETQGLSENLIKLKSNMKNVKKIHLSMDLDSINPALAPGVSVPVKSGFTPKDIHSIIDFLFEHFEIVSVDVVEYNPVEDINDQTLKIMKNIIRFIVGKY